MAGVVLASVRLLSRTLVCLLLSRMVAQLLSTPECAALPSTAVSMDWGDYVTLSSGVARLSTAAVVQLVLIMMRSVQLWKL